MDQLHQLFEVSKTAKFCNQQCLSVYKKRKQKQKRNQENSVQYKLIQGYDIIQLFIKNMLIILLLMMSLTFSQWKLIDSSLNGNTIQLSEEGWIPIQQQIGNCQNNNEQQVILDNTNSQINKSISTKVQGVQVTFDLMYDFSVNDNLQYIVEVDLIYTSGSQNISNVIYTKTLKPSQLALQSRICNDQLQDYSFQLFNIQSIQQTVPLTNFTIMVKYTSQNKDNIIRIKNFQIFGFFCSPFCKTCSFASPTICQSCISTDSHSNCACPIISTKYQYMVKYFQEGQGCIDECSRNQYVAQSDLICHQDLRVAGNSNFLMLDQSQILYSAIATSQLSTQKFTSYCHDSSTDYIAGPYATQVVKLQLGTLQTLGILRFRISLYIMNIDYTTLNILVGLDGIDYFQFSMDSNLTFTSYGNGVDLYFNNVMNCQTRHNDILYRFELVQLPTSLNPVLSFDATMGKSIVWGFSNITVDVAICKLNCYLCADTNTCTQCQAGYFLYLSECVQSCPIYSTNCIDYGEEISISSYLVKAFYNTNMTLDQILQNIDSVTNTYTNFLTGQKFSFLNNKIVLGGLLVWNNAKYSKIYSIAAAHYAISLRFNITFGDDFSGSFNYYIDTVQQETIIRMPTAFDQNLIGKSSTETIQFVYKYFSHTQNTLKIDFECLTSQSLQDSFCAISEYFIVVHQCVSTCQACTSLDVCTSGTVTPCLAPSFWSYDSTTTSYICTTCTISYCSNCISNLQCRTCTFQLNNKFSLNQGQCICDSKYYRSIVDGKCQCNAGYFDDPLNYNCWPICGDQIIVQGEECDDGNLIPFDGCHQCRFQCQIECSICIQGQCQLCEQGYTLINNICYPQCDVIVNQFPCSLNDFMLKQYMIEQLFCPNNKLLIDQSCQSVCGDGYWQDNEQCDNSSDQQMTFGCYKCQCQEGYISENGICISICGDGIKTTEEECDDGNNTSFDGCSSICLLECINCNSIYCIANICSLCNSGYYIDSNQQCNLTECGDGIIVGQELCDDGNQTSMDGCFNCQCEYGWYLNKTICESKCGDGIKVSNEECDDDNHISLDGCSSNCKFECINCVNCVVGICQECQQGYYFDSNQICNKTICGDKIKIKEEQCDDGNLVINDGCSDCLCEQGWQPNQNGCQSICGDDILVKGEQCDDGNDIQYDGCYNCKYDCNKECEICELGNCQKCKYGFNLIDNNCINTCGDGILNRFTEECDDKNNLPRDGCFNCKIEQGFLCFDDNLIFKGCQRCSDTNCINCILDNSIEKCTNCQSGYYLNEKQECLQCDPICIDCIKTGKNCINYDFNIYQVKQCDNSKGLYYSFELRDCIPLCGDGIIQGDEQCDDKNIDDFDGCNSLCQIEKGYLLDSSTQQIITEPKVKVEFQSTDNFQYSIKADQYQEAINCTAIVLNIELFNKTDFNYTTHETDSNCDLEIQYFKSIEPSNLIHIFVAFKGQYKARLLQEINQQQSSQEIVVVPSRQPYVSQEQKEQGQKVAAASKTVSQSLMVLGPLAILAGGFKFIWAVLDILSWLNNFYFLNVTYPENVRQIFLQAQWSNIIDFPSVSYFNNPDDSYYFQAPKKFSDKGIDPLFFNNIQTIIFFLFQVIVTKIVCKLFIKLMTHIYKKPTSQHQTKLSIFKLGESQVGFQVDKCQNDQDQRKLQIPKIFQSLYKKCAEFDECFTANLLQTIQISFLDLTLAIVLQVCNQQTSNYVIVRINTIIAYIVMAILFLLLWFSYQISVSHQLKLENKCFNIRYSCFYEDVKTDSQLAMLYSFINLIRKTIFIVSTVIFYFQPIYQTSFCFMSSLLNIFILIQHNPFEEKQQYLLNFIPDFSVFIITGITIFFAFQDAFLIFDEQLIYFLGWIMVSLIYSSIALQIGFLIKQMISDLWEKIKKIANMCKKKSEKPTV